MTGANIEPILLAADDAIVLASAYQEDQDITIYLLSDPDLLNTHGLADRDTAQTALKIIDAIAPAKGEPVVFDLTLHGVERSRNLLKLMLEPPFLPATLCLVLAGVLVGLNAVTSRRMPRQQRRELEIGALTLVENSALLVTQARKDVAMSRRYAAMTRATTTARIGGQSGLTEAQQVDLLDAAARFQKLPSFSELAAAAAAARTPSQMMAAVRNLHRWTQEFGRDRRRS